MISKKVISDIVSKYSLGNNIEKVKWVVKDKKLLINFINELYKYTTYCFFLKRDPSSSLFSHLHELL